MSRKARLKNYKKRVDRALGDSFLGESLDRYVTLYRSRTRLVTEDIDVAALVAEISGIKERAIADMDVLFERFKQNAEQRGVKVHLAEDAEAANRIIADIAEKGGVKSIVKSKSMTSEETRLNKHLEAEGFEVNETDLGEWIIQLRGEGPSHMVTPAIHLSRFQVAEDFSKFTGRPLEPDAAVLSQVARRYLRGKYFEAGMGITGANFAVADTGAIGLVTNEGNARLVTTLPKIHVALVGLEKLVPTIGDALTINRLLPRNGARQKITSYVTWINGRVPSASSPGWAKERHIVFLDNRRREIAADPVFAPILKCVRCGACATVCPIYRRIGGHSYGHIYIGAIGFLLTYFYHGAEFAEPLLENCINCGACREVCSAGINLPNLIMALRERMPKNGLEKAVGTVMAGVMPNRTLFHGALRMAEVAQKALTAGSPYLERLPASVARSARFRAVPALAQKPFRDIWRQADHPLQGDGPKVAIFGGCLQDFVYPEQLEAGAKVLEGLGARLVYPMAQSCCGLPLRSMGEKKSARDMAEKNLRIFAESGCDYIVTLCASCASFLQEAYPHLFEDSPQMLKAAREFAGKVHLFSEFINDVLDVSAEDFRPAGLRTTYHSPCHTRVCLRDRETPRKLIRKMGLDFVPGDEEETCCGFGGTYSEKFPVVSARILDKKLDDIRNTGAGLLLTECPGCILQLRGGARKKGDSVRVEHLAEALAGAWIGNRRNRQQTKRN